MGSTIELQGQSESVINEYIIALRQAFNIENNIDRSFKIFFVVRQQHNSPADQTSNCVNYPTEEYDSYADCDEDFVRRSLPVGLVPFWSVSNTSLASNNYSMTHLNSSQKNKLRSTLGISTSTGCLKKRVMFVQFAITLRNPSEMENSA